MYKTVRASIGTKSYDPAKYDIAPKFTSTRQHGFAQCGTVLKSICTLLYQIARAKRCDLVRVLFAARPHTLNYRDVVLNVGSQWPTMYLVPMCSCSCRTCYYMPVVCTSIYMSTTRNDVSRTTTLPAFLLTLARRASSSRKAGSLKS